MIMFQQMVILFIVMMIGLIARKYEIITDDSSRKLSALVVNVTNPCFILSSVSEGSTIQGKEFAVTIMIAVAVYVLFIVVAAFLPELLGVKKGSRGVYRAMIVFTNLGFMGFPIISGIYGNEALLYGAAFLLLYNILIYTYGIYVMKSDCTDPGEENEKLKKLNGFNPMLLINLGTIASVLAIIIYMTGFKMPYIASKTVGMVGNATAPLSMMIIGASFININLKELLHDYRILVFSLIKLIIIPVALGFAIKFFVKDPVITGVSTIMTATPVGSMVAMLANQYGGDIEESTKGVALTTLLSVITLPVVTLIIG